MELKVLNPLLALSIGIAAFVAYSQHQTITAPATGPLGKRLTPSFADPLVPIAAPPAAAAALFGLLLGLLAKALSKSAPASA